LVVYQEFNDQGRFCPVCLDVKNWETCLGTIRFLLKSRGLMSGNAIDAMPTWLWWGTPLARTTVLPR